MPRSKGGRQTEYLHRICHRQIHALFTETELARRYATVEALLAHPEVFAGRNSFVTLLNQFPHAFERVMRMLAASRWAADSVPNPASAVPLAMACATRCCNAC